MKTLYHYCKNFNQLICYETYYFNRFFSIYSRTLSITVQKNTNVYLYINANLCQRIALVFHIFAIVQTLNCSFKLLSYRIEQMNSYLLFKTHSGNTISKHTVLINTGLPRTCICLPIEERMEL